MEESEYLELDILLSKLRVFCLKSLAEDGVCRNVDERIRKMQRAENERNIKLVRNIDFLRRNMPLKAGEGTINII